MKKKIYFLLTTAMLFVSASAFAQSSNIEPARGDVNGDGTVDVADIVAVMQIMKEAGGAVGEKMAYWYAGTDEVTPDNFTNVSSRIAESEIPETGSLTAGGKFVYFVMPNTRSLSSLVDGAGTPVEFECSDIMGYNIYRTKNEAFGSLSYTIKETVYYWYVGHVTEANAMNNTYMSNLVNGKNPTSDTTGPSTLTMPTTTGEILIYIYPTVWGTPSIVDDTGYGTGDTTFEEAGLTSPTGYKVRFWSGDSSVRGRTLQITWTK